MTDDKEPRIVTPTGEPAGDVTGRDEEAEKAAPAGESAEAAKEKFEEMSSPPGELPPLDFSTFILSLSSSVLMNLGVVENPVTKKTEKEPAAAKQTIDLIALLKEKTEGNLDEGEEKLMSDVLHDLRLWYVKVMG